MLKRLSVILVLIVILFSQGVFFTEAKDTEESSTELVLQYQADIESAQKEFDAQKEKINEENLNFEKASEKVDTAQNTLSEINEGLSKIESANTNLENIQKKVTKAHEEAIRAAEGANILKSDEEKKSMEDAQKKYIDAEKAKKTAEKKLEDVKKEVLGSEGTEEALIQAKAIAEESLSTVTDEFNYVRNNQVQAELSNQKSEDDLNNAKLKGDLKQQKDATEYFAEKAQEKADEAAVNAEQSGSEKDRLEADKAQEAANKAKDAAEKAATAYSESSLSDGDITDIGFTIHVDGLTPGMTVKDKGTTAEERINYALATIIQRGMIFLGSAALLIMTVGAGYIITHHGQDELLSKGKSIFMSGVYALIVALSSYYIVAIFRYILYQGNT